MTIPTTSSAVQSAVVIVCKQDDPKLFLAVESLDRPGKIGLPAGKKDISENCENTIIRKCYEKTGVKITVLCYLDCKTTKNSICHLYVAFDYKNNPIIKNLDRVPSWRTRDFLCDRKSSKFPTWNDWAFSKYDTLYIALRDGNFQRNSFLSRSGRTFVQHIESARIESINNNTVLNFVKQKLPQLSLAETVRGRERNKISNRLFDKISSLILEESGTVGGYFGKLDGLFFLQTLLKYNTDIDLPHHRYKFILDQIVIEWKSRQNHEGKTES